MNNQCQMIIGGSIMILKQGKNYKSKQIY